MNVVSAGGGGVGAARELEQRRMREVRVRVINFILNTLNRVIGMRSGLRILTGICSSEQSGDVSCS
jgi:hypothetical protein